MAARARSIANMPHGGGRGGGGVPLQGTHGESEAAAAALGLHVCDMCTAALEPATFSTNQLTEKAKQPGVFHLKCKPCAAKSELEGVDAGGMRTGGGGGGHGAEPVRSASGLADSDATVTESEGEDDDAAAPRGGVGGGGKGNGPAHAQPPRRWNAFPPSRRLVSPPCVYVFRAVQFHPHGGQSDFVWLSALTPHGAYVW